MHHHIDNFAESHYRIIRKLLDWPLADYITMASHTKAKYSNLATINFRYKDLKKLQLRAKTQQNFLFMSLNHCEFYDYCFRVLVS